MDELKDTKAMWERFNWLGRGFMILTFPLLILIFIQWRLMDLVCFCMDKFEQLTTKPLS